MSEATRVGDRMSTALQRRGWDARRFHGEMRPRLNGGKSGSAYNTILAYLNNQSEPSLEFLRQAADVLGVRQEWLIVGVEVDDARADFRAWLKNLADAEAVVSAAAVLRYLDRLSD